MIKIIYREKKFICRTDFENRKIPERNEFIWEPNEKYWFTNRYDIAKRLSEYMDDNAKEQLNRVIISISDRSFPLIVPPKLSLLPHQIEACEFLLKRNRSYIGLDPGLGKTIVAAVAAASINACVVYVCPSYLMLNVESEFNKWAPSLITRILGGYDIFGRTDVLIIPDSILNRDDIQKAVEYHLAEQPLKRKRMLIVDEAHRYKNEEAQRTQAFLGDEKEKGLKCLLDNRFDHIAPMSGTPMPNRPMELFPILNRLAPECINFADKEAFGLYFCGGFYDGYGYDFSGSSNLHILRKKVMHPHGPFMLRIKKDVLNLPPKIREIVVLNGEMSKHLTELSNKALADYSPTDIIRGKIANELGLSEEELNLATYRRLLSLEKIKSTAEFVSNVLDETEEKIIIFGVHTEAIYLLAEELKKYNPLVITGKTNKLKRNEHVKSFQTSKSRRLIIGNIAAMGVGFTMTKANRVIFHEFSYVPGENTQAEDRANRIGSTFGLLVQYLVFKNSFDRTVMEINFKKERVINYI